MDDINIQNDIYIAKDKKFPREGIHADSPGAYGLAIRLTNTVINPGDLLEGELFISGYGNISLSKLVFYPSPNLIDTNENASYILTGLGDNNDNKAKWGNERISISHSGVALDLSESGLSLRNWERATPYFDTDTHPLPTIATERKLAGSAPMHLFLKTKKDALPGVYSLQFLYTYYDSQQWQNCLYEIQFTLRNFYQRHEIKVWLLGAFAALISTIVAIYTIVGWFLPSKTC